MDYIVVGGNRLHGELPVCGAKNCALALLGASILTDDALILNNCPQIEDVENMLLLLNKLGKKVKREGTVVSVCGQVYSTCVASDISSLLRGSVLVLGSLVARCGEAHLPTTGGCAIGRRPIDIHLEGLREMGVSVSENEEVVCLGKPTACNYKLRFPSVGATENLLCAATLAKGTTTLMNCATEPEVVALENALQLMGAKLNGVGESCVTVTGVSKLHGACVDVIPDRIVAATYLSCCVAAMGNLTVTECNPKHLTAFLQKLQPFKPTVGNDYVSISVNRRLNDFGRTITAPYPHFPTDMQQILTSLCAMSDGGKSFVTEKLFENRLRHNAEQLNSMGASIRIVGDTAVIEGRKLHGTQVEACDLRGGAGLVVAALGADGVTQIGGAQHILRGYCNFAENLRSVGANVRLCWPSENDFD